ncbi:metalloprotease PmbA [Alcanivorax sp. N3-2A]|nr:metalloprotease PmbA [Alcanivorax sp. N3-2A]|tara:strand:- start:32744 stop:34099 length:1356 start_codon:yes stop_codon:yes gene_type:complete
MSEPHGASANLDPRQLNSARDTVAFVLEEARRQGASSAEAHLSLAQGLSVNVRLGEVETVEFHRDRGVAVSVYMGNRKGASTTSDDSPQSLRDAVAAACAIARHTEEDPFGGIAEAGLLATDLPDLDLYHPWEISTEQAIAEALRSESVARDDPRIVNSEGASVTTGTSLRVLGTSNGFLQGYAGSFHSRGCAVLAEDDAGMQRDYWYDGSRDPSRIASPESVGERARLRTLARLGAEVPETGELPVMFAPEVAAGLLGHFVSAISGGSLYRRASFLRDRLGERLFPAGINLREQAHLPGGNGSAPYDSDGLPTFDQAFVEDGVLRRYVLGLYAARRLEMAPTGNGGGVHNLIISDTGEDQAALLKRMGNGILITEVMGQGVNLVTGDYSRGAAGFRVENGVLGKPLQEFTIAGNLAAMFAGLQGSGTDVDARGNIRCGSLLLAPMKIAGR